jgi:hypothetical protein
MIVTATLCRPHIFQRKLTPADELFSPDALASFVDAPVQVGHDGRAIGRVVSVAREGQVLRGVLDVDECTAQAIAIMQLLHPVGVSIHFTCRHEPSASEYYDCVTRGVRCSHVAILMTIKPAVSLDCIIDPIGAAA